MYRSRPLTMTARPTTAMSASIPFPGLRPRRCSQWISRASSPTPSPCGQGEQRLLLCVFSYIASILKSTTSNPGTQILGNQSCWFYQAQPPNFKRHFLAWLHDINVCLMSGSPGPTCSRWWPLTAGGRSPAPSWSPSPSPPGAPPPGQVSSVTIMRDTWHGSDHQHVAEKVK